MKIYITTDESEKYKINEIKKILHGLMLTLSIYVTFLGFT
jgi:hypothetical protein